MPLGGHTVGNTVANSNLAAPLAFLTGEHQGPAYKPSWFESKVPHHLVGRAFDWLSSPRGMTTQCPECGSFFSSKGLGSHRWRAHGAGRSHKPIKPGTRPAWNKGLLKTTNESLAKQARSVSRSIQAALVEGSWAPRRPGSEAREATSRRMTEKNPGGRCQWFKVDGQTVQGTWERDLAQKMCEIGVPWVRTVAAGNRSWSYQTEDGRRHWYTPDFLLPDPGLQLELKGFWWGQDKRKMELVTTQNPSVRIKIVQADLFKRLLAAPDRGAFLDLLL